MRYVQGAGTSEGKERYRTTTTGSEASAFWNRGLIERTRELDIKQRNEEIIRRHVAGERHESIAKDFRLAINTISTICIGVKRKRKPKRKRNPVKNKRNERIRKRYAEGETQKAIANRYGISQETVYLICKGVKRKAGRIVAKRLSRKEREERNAAIRERHGNGETVKAIAKDHEICERTIYRICRGVERKVKPKRGRKKDPEKEKRDERIRERYAEGETLSAIGKDYNLTRQGVSIICRGVERKRK